MSKSKHNIRVCSFSGRDGVSWTTRRGARRIVERGLAEWEGPDSIRMVAADHRLCSERPAVEPPKLEVVPFRASHPPANPLGFLRYPDQPQEVLKRWREQKRRQKAA